MTHLKDKPFALIDPLMLRYQRIWVIGKVPSESLPAGTTMRSESVLLERTFSMTATRRFRDLEPLPLRAVLAEGWRGPHLHRSKLRARLDPRRAAQLAGKYAGLRWPGT